MSSVATLLLLLLVPPRAVAQIRSDLASGGLSAPETSFMRIILYFLMFSRVFLPKAWSKAILIEAI